MDDDPDVEENCSNEDVDMENGEGDLNKTGSNWFEAIISTYRRYKRGIFGDSWYEKSQRLPDFTININYKFIFAKYTDGFYRPGSIVGRNKKLKVFIVNFYHNRKCIYVQPRDIVLKHGNLLDKKVFFTHNGCNKKGTVFGNNAPATNSFPTLFYIKRKKRWYRINIKDIFLTKRQVNKLYFTATKKRPDSRVC